MILISHRGNLNGKSDRENQPDYTGEALDQGFDVEIDVWYHQHEFYLGHDEPQYKIDEKFLEKEGLWCHAKNIDALNQMIENERIHCFFHQEDDVTLTSEGFLWTNIGEQLTSNSIAVLIPKHWDEMDLVDKDPPEDVAGVCSDYIGRLV